MVHRGERRAVVISTLTEARSYRNDSCLYCKGVNSSVELFSTRAVLNDTCIMKCLRLVRDTEPRGVEKTSTPIQRKKVLGVAHISCPGFISASSHIHLSVESQEMSYIVIRGRHVHFPESIEVNILDDFNLDSNTANQTVNV